MKSMPNSHRAYSNRRVTPASLQTDRTVASYQSDHQGGSSMTRPSRTQALQVAKRYASAIGLKAAKIALIDQLFAFSKAMDWTDTQTIPVVWPSNELLATAPGHQNIGTEIPPCRLGRSGSDLLLGPSDIPAPWPAQRGWPHRRGLWHQFIANCCSLLRIAGSRGRRRVLKHGSARASPIGAPCSEGASRHS